MTVPYYVNEHQSDIRAIKSGRASPWWQARQKDVQPGNKMVVVYDGECPFCRNYIRLMSLRKAVGDVELVDARTQAPAVRRLVELGYDLNEGMAAIYGGKVYYGKDAVALISSLTGDRDWMDRVLTTSLRNPTRVTFLYPLMKLGRRVALRMLGKPLI
jgi:predicted DCC family thiol-disulfide oxidoreductase YuxK